MQPSTRTILMMAGTLTLSARLVVLTAAFVLTAVAHGQITWYVDDDYCPEPGSGTLADPFCSIQVAINAAINGDEVVVARGTYVELINFSGKAITVRSTEPSDPGVVINTVIDGNGLGTVVMCNSGEGSNSVLRGFTITGGMGTGVTVGGGMLNDGSSPTVTYCTFSLNTAFFGGGMYNNASNPTVTDCTFSENTASGQGGGMFNRRSSPTVTDCTFSENTASIQGGGMSNINLSSPTVTGCEFTGNSANNHPQPNHYTRGGGMFNAGLSSPTVINCTFSLNTADKGGGMHNIYGSSPTMTNCAFGGNTAPQGGGMYNLGASPMMTNCTFSRNTTGGFGIGSAIYTQGGIPTVTNGVIWANFPVSIQVIGLIRIRYSNIQFDCAGTGNINADPMFVDPENGDYRLSPGSPCIDAGHNWLAPQDTTDLDADGETAELAPFDLDGNPRFVADPADADLGCGIPAIVDMGAYEFQIGSPFPVKLGDIDGDGIVGIVDFLDLLAAWGSCTAATCCLADLDLDENVGITDFSLLLGNWR